MPRYISLVHTTGHIRLFSSALALWALGGGALAPLDGQERPRPAPPVVADSGLSEAWNAPVAHAIAARAIEARAHVYADTSLRAFEATAQGHVYFLAGFQGEREVVRADQIALDVRWQAPNRALQTIVGRRHEIRLPTNIRYHIDHLSLVLDNFGDRIQLGDGDEVWNVLHPAAPGAPEFYDYRLADSLEIRIRDRAVRVFELELRPRDAADPGAVGSMFVDRESGAIARLRVTFTAAAYRDPDLVRIVLDLRSALWEGRYWLPAEQDLEITRSLSWFDFPVESIIRTRLRVLEYRLNGEPEFPLAHGQRVATLPEAALDGFDAWADPLYGGPLEVGDRSDRELEAALRDARRLVRPRALAGGERFQLALPNASAGLRARRAEGLLVGGGGAYRPSDSGSLSLWSGYATGIERPEARVTLTHELGPWSGTLDLALRSMEDVGPFAAASGVGQTLGLAFEGEDYTDPYFEDGGRLGLARQVGAGRFEVGASVLRQRSAALVMRTAFIGDRALRAVRPIDDGELAALDASLGVALGRALGAAWSAEARVEAATAVIGSFGFARVIARVRGERGGLGSPWAWSSDLVLGGAGGELPSQRLFILGGRGTLPGFPFRAWGGDRVALWRLEASRGLVSPWVRVRATAAAGWTALGGVGSDAASRFGAVETGGVRTAAGLGLGLFYDLLRIDVVRGLGEGPRACDAGGASECVARGDWVLLMSLNPLLWEIL